VDAKIASIIAENAGPKAHEAARLSRRQQEAAARDAALAARGP
jgi:hypothetical protein